MSTTAFNDLALLQVELNRVAADALNRELRHRDGLRLASRRRAKRIIAEAMARHLADRLIVTIDATTKRIDVRWPRGAAHGEGRS